MGTCPCQTPGRFAGAAQICNRPQLHIFGLGLRVWVLGILVRLQPASEGDAGIAEKVFLHKPRACKQSLKVLPCSKAGTSPFTITEE